MYQFVSSSYISERIKDELGQNIFTYAEAAY